MYFPDFPARNCKTRLTGTVCMPSSKSLHYVLWRAAQGNMEICVHISSGKYMGRLGNKPNLPRQACLAGTWLPLRPTASSCHEPTVLGSKDKKFLKTDIKYSRNDPGEYEIN
jgi:hypothetical protein